MRPLTALWVFSIAVSLIVAALCFHPNMSLKLDDSSEWSVSASTATNYPVGSQPEGIPAVKEKPAARGGNK